MFLSEAQTPWLVPGSSREGGRQCGGSAYQGVKSRSEGGATGGVRQLKRMVSARKTKVTAIAAMAATVGDASNRTERNTKVTAPQALLGLCQFLLLGNWIIRGRAGRGSARVHV